MFNGSLRQGVRSVLPPQGSSNSHSSDSINPQVLAPNFGSSDPAVGRLLSMIRPESDGGADKTAVREALPIPGPRPFHDSGRSGCARFRLLWKSVCSRVPMERTNPVSQSVPA
jgi:hypothetical protein